MDNCDLNLKFNYFFIAQRPSHIRQTQWNSFPCPSSQELIDDIYSLEKTETSSVASFSQKRDKWQLMIAAPPSFTTQHIHHNNSRKHDFMGHHTQALCHIIHMGTTSTTTTTGPDNILLISRQLLGMCLYHSQSPRSRKVLVPTIPGQIAAWGLEPQNDSAPI